MSTLQPIDINSSKFFWLLQPWRDGKLVTFDGWGRFSEISFTGAKKMHIKHLVNFPRVLLDRELITWTEAGLITARTSAGVRHLLAAIDDKKTKSHTPHFTRAHIIHAPVLLDPREGLIGYCYRSKIKKNTEVIIYVYNYKEDKIVDKREGSIYLNIAIDNQWAIGTQRILYGDEIENKCIFYNWRTNKIIENELTKTISELKTDMNISLNRNIHLSKRYLYDNSRRIDRWGQRVRMTWDENYENVKVTPLSYLLPEGKSLEALVLSIDGSWGTTLIYGYRGVNEYLFKRAFFHMDNRYPNGISMPVITEDYEEYQWEYSAFVEHPVHGMCFAQEWHKEEKLYLRLYKMSDVLDEINRQLLEKARGVIQKK